MRLFDFDLQVRCSSDFWKRLLYMQSYGNPVVVCADEKLTAFVELELATRAL
jgi:hypothetical protein